MTGVSIVETEVLLQYIELAKENNQLLKKLINEKQLPERLYTTEEAMVRLNCGRRYLTTIREQLRPVKYGKGYKYKESEITKFLNRTTI